MVKVFSSKFFLFGITISYKCISFLKILSSDVLYKFFIFGTDSMSVLCSSSCVLLEEFQVCCSFQQRCILLNLVLPSSIFRLNGEEHQMRRILFV